MLSLLLVSRIPTRSQRAVRAEVQGCPAAGSSQSAPRTSGRGGRGGKWPCSGSRTLWTLHNWQTDNWIPPSTIFSIFQSFHSIPIPEHKYKIILILLQPNNGIRLSLLFIFIEISTYGISAYSSKITKCLLLCRCIRKLSEGRVIIIIQCLLNVYNLSPFFIFTNSSSSNGYWLWWWWCEVNRQHFLLLALLGICTYNVQMYIA